MRVLWLTHTPSNYGIGKTVDYNGGGWISSAEQAMDNQDITLAIAFYMFGQPEKVKQGNVTYYPMRPPKKSLLYKVLRGIFWTSKSIEMWLWDEYVKSIITVIEDFKPDIIHVYGSEFTLGLIAPHTNIPVVLHIQGVLNPYLNAFCPPMISLNKFYILDWNPISIYKRFMSIISWRRNCFREEYILKHVKYFIGRTEWDKRVIKVYNPDARYFYGGEILRPVFYKVSNRVQGDKCVIVSTISQPMYKGLDLILKTANVLKSQLGVSFEWRVYGNVDPRLCEKVVHLNHNELNIKLCGVASAEELYQELLHSSVYFHPSYIDNSPNSLCEAQIVGVPVIATYVGGVPSLVKDGITGFLVPANDPYQSAYLIESLCRDFELNKKIGENAKLEAFQRHDSKKITDSLMKTYYDIVKIQNKEVPV